MALGVSGNVGKREIVSRGREKKSLRAGRTTLAEGLELELESEGAGDGDGRACATLRFFVGWLFETPGVDGRDDSESDGMMDLSLTLRQHGATPAVGLGLGYSSQWDAFRRPALYYIYCYHFYVCNRVFLMPGSSLAA